MNFNLYNSYSLAMNLLGFDRQISHFMDDLVLDHPNVENILDVGCGTGVMGLQLAQRFSGATLLATDIQERFLQGVMSNSEKMGIGQDRISVGLSDISTPSDVTLVPGDSVMLEKESFDLISVGAVIGYSKDQSGTIRALLNLVKPGGTLINLEMNERLMGRWTSHRYEYDVMPLNKMEATMVGEGCVVSMLPLSLTYFPASATRIGILAVKKQT